MSLRKLFGKNDDQADAKAPLTDEERAAKAKADEDLTVASAASTVAATTVVTNAGG